MVLPVFLSYVLSFVFLGIYWNNHHHLLRATKRINGRIMWANLHLLFWLSFGSYVLVAVMWFIPDLRIERLTQAGEGTGS